MLSDVGDCNVVPNIEKPSWIRTIAVWIAMTRMMNVSSHDGFIRAWPGSPSQKSRRNIILRRQAAEHREQHDHAGQLHEDGAERLGRQRSSPRGSAQAQYDADDERGQYVHAHEHALVGEYQARVVAFPAVGDTTSSMSSPACVDFIAEGEQSLPTLEYFWDSFSDTLNLQLSNVGTYTYEAYPKEVEVVCTNVNDDADVVTATLENVATDNIDFSAALTKGETYKISAHSISDSNYVTNKVSGDTLVADNMTVGDVNVLSSAYAYSHGSVNFPLLTENFDLVNGGSAGDMHGVISDYSYDCTPTAATPGSAYSYDVSIYYADQGDGKLELHEDGTATLSHGQWAFIRAAHIDGVWIDNGDGTATLNFNTSSVASD